MLYDRIAGNALAIVFRDFLEECNFKGEVVMQKGCKDFFKAFRKMAKVMVVVGLACALSCSGTVFAVKFNREEVEALMKFVRNHRKVLGLGTSNRLFPCDVQKIEEGIPWKEVSSKLNLINGPNKNRTAEQCCDEWKKHLRIIYFGKEKPNRSKRKNKMRKEFRENRTFYENYLTREFSRALAVPIFETIRLRDDNERVRANRRVVLEVSEVSIPELASTDHGRIEPQR